MLKRRIRKAGLTQSDVYISRPLSSLSVAYTQDQSEFVADRIFPIVPVAKQADKYWKYTREDWNRAQMKKRADGAESQGAGFGTTTDTYFAHVWALHVDIGDQTRANVDLPMDMDRDATNFLTLQGLLRRESSFATTYMASGVWSFSYDGVSSGATAVASLDPTNGSNNNVLQWNDASSTPVEDMRRAKTYMILRTGIKPNKLVMGQQVYDALVDHPDIIDRIKYSSGNNTPAIVNKTALAALFEVDEVVVSSAVINGAEEGATEANTFLLGKNALLVYAPRRPGLLTPSAGYTFVWRDYLGNSTGALQISKMRIPTRKSDRIEGETAFDQKVVAPDLGFFFNGIVA